MKKMLYLSGTVVLSLLMRTASAQYYPPLPPAELVPSTEIASITDFYNVVCVATQWVLVFGLIVGVLFVIYGGFRYVTAGGDSSKEGDAKKTILGAIIGVVFLVLAIAIVRIIASFFGGNISNFSITTCNY